jgi:hypothetical protein
MTTRSTASLARLVSCCGASCPRLPVRRIVGHSDIAPGRKTDPGSAFDWTRLRRMLKCHARRRRHGRVSPMTFLAMLIALAAQQLLHPGNLVAARRLAAHDWEAFVARHAALVPGCAALLTLAALLLLASWLLGVG